MTNDFLTTKRLMIFVGICLLVSVLALVVSVVVATAFSEPSRVCISSALYENGVETQSGVECK